MCVLCMMSPNLNPLTLDTSANTALGAILFEGADAAESVDTLYTMSVGDTFNGEISSTSDEDWIAIELEAGSFYEISLEGGTLSDTYLTILNRSGNFAADDDDGGAFSDSLLTMQASYSGTFYIEADAFFNETGTYRLTVLEAEEPVVELATFDELAEYLQYGGTSFDYIWDTRSSNEITVDITGLTAEGQQLAIWAMEAWEMVADIDFLVRGGGYNEYDGTEMITADDNYAGAYAYFPNSTDQPGVVGGVELNVSTNWLTIYGTTIDSYSFQTYVHEFGHALGLNHQGDYSGNGSYATDAIFANDSWQVSIMSYFSQTDNTSINASYAGLVGPMIADIVAIQNMYGEPGSSGATAGDTTWGGASELSNYLDEVFDVISSGVATSNFTNSDIAYTIYDQDGQDTLDLGYLDSSTNARIDLNDGTFSDIGAGIGVLGIAVDTVIEDLRTGSGDDTLTGNETNNGMFSGTGNDMVYAGDGDDFIGAGAGDDIVEGGAGNDTVYGSGGRDNISGDSGNDFIAAGTNHDVAYGGDGEDAVWGGGGRDSIYGGRNDDILGGSFGADTMYGNSGDDMMFGQVANDMMYGGDGNDDMGGGSGSDELFGGNGNDTLNGSFGRDVLTGDAGADTFVFTSTGSDRVTDFDLSEGDQIGIDLLALGVTGSMTGTEIVDTYALIDNGTVVINVEGAIITLDGVSRLDDLDTAVSDYSMIA